MTTPHETLPLRRRPAARARPSTPPPVLAAANDAPPAHGIDDAKARDLVEAWRKYAHVLRQIGPTKTGWQVGTVGTQIEYLASTRQLVVRQGTGVARGAPLTDSAALRERLASEAHDQKAMLAGSTLELAVLPYRHLDPERNRYGTRAPALEIVAVKTVDDAQINRRAFVGLVNATTRAGFAWHVKRQPLFRNAS